MKRLTIFAVAVFVSAWAYVAHALPIAKMNRLTNVVAVDEPDFVELRLAVEQRQDLGKLEPTINFKTREISLLLGNTFLQPSKKTYRQLGIDSLNRVFTYQAGQNMTAVKIVHTPKLELKPGRVTIAKNDEGIVIRLWRTEPIAEKDLAAEVLATRKTAAEPKLEASAPTSMPSEGVADAKAPIDIDKIFADAAPKPAPEKATEPEAEPKRDSASIKTGSSVPDLWTGAVKMASALAGVVGLIFLLAWAVKRYGKISTLQSRVGGAPFVKPVRVIASAPLGLKKQVSLVEVAGELLVLGVSDQAVNLLARIDDPEMRRRYLGDAAAASAGAPPAKTNEPAVPVDKFEMFGEAAESPARRAQDSPFARELRQYQQLADLPANSDVDRDRDDALRAIRDRLAGMKRLQ